MKLLIVDDHVAMRRLIGRVVSDMVSEIEECGDGAEALDAYHRCLPDWVLMDIEMDRIDGITATGEILLSYPRTGRDREQVQRRSDSGGGPKSGSLRICVERKPHGNPQAAAGRDRKN